MMERYISIYRNLLSKSILTIMIVNTYERSYEGEGLAIGGQNSRVNLASWRQEERDTHQRQPKQGSDDCYQQLHPRAVVCFHRRLSLEQNEHFVFLKEQNFSKFSKISRCIQKKSCLILKNLVLFLLAYGLLESGVFIAATATLRAAARRSLRAATRRSLRSARS